MQFLRLPKTVSDQGKGLLFMSCEYSKAHGLGRDVPKAKLAEFGSGPRVKTTTESTPCEADMLRE